MNYRLKVPNIRYLMVEKLTFAYILITSLIIVITRYGTYSGFELLKYRLIIACIIIALAYVNNIKDGWIIRILRVAFLGGLLSYWYPETYEINRALPNFDFILANFEQSIFGFQPAFVFSKHFTQLWFSELMNMGYFLYYPLIIGTALYFYFANPKYFGLFFFTVLFSFYLYYIIYIIFPTAGPQYYYYAIGMDNVLSGNFPEVGYYFNYHNTLLANQDNSGLLLSSGWKYAIVRREANCCLSQFACRNFHNHHDYDCPIQKIFCFWIIIPDIFDIGGINSLYSGALFRRCYHGFCQCIRILLFECSYL